MLVLVPDDGAAFCHAITDSVGKANLVKEVLHLLVEGCSANDALVEVATKGRIEFVANLAIDHLPQHGDSGKSTDVTCAQDGKYLFLYDFLQNEGHDDDHYGLNLSECLDDHMR